MLRSCHLRVCARHILIGLALLLTSVGATSADDGFSAGTLRGLKRINVAVEGIAPSFERYGLTTMELRQQIEQRLTAASIAVADDTAAQSDPAVGQLRIKLYTVEGMYSLYSYAVAAQVRRKVPLGADNRSFVSQAVWSRGQNGMLNPSDLRRIYTYTDTLVDAFIAAHGVDNGAATASP